MRLPYRRNLVYFLVILGCIFIYRFIDRVSLTRVVYQSLPSREAGLLSGMLLGDVSGFEKEFWDSLKISGLLHLVVVSGSNMMLVFKVLVEKLAIVFGRKKAIGLGFLIALLYVDLVGWQIPVVRALILISVMYWAQLLGRKYNLVRGLILSVLIIFLAWPGSFLEVSFWLSFVAFIALNTSFWKDNFRTSVWISLWISPILAITFGSINLINPVSNFLVLLIVEVVTIIGFFGLILGYFVPFLGKMFLWIIWPLLKYFVVVVEMIGRWKWSSVDVNFNWIILFGWYLVLFWIFLKLKKKLYEKKIGFID